MTNRQRAHLLASYGATARQTEELLVPKDTTGKPTSGAHAKGEIYLDSVASIFVCTKGGTPGTWRKVTTTSA